MWSMSSGLPCRSGVALVGADERHEVDHAEAVALGLGRETAPAVGSILPDGLRTIWGVAASARR
jgi:hypothetical protein